MEKKEMKGGVFSECLLIFFGPGVRTDRGGRGGGSAKCRQLQTEEGGEGSKITKNVRTFFMDGPIQKTMSPRKSQEDVMIKFCKS